MMNCSVTGNLVVIPQKSVKGTIADKPVTTRRYSNKAAKFFIQEFGYAFGSISPLYNTNICNSCSYCVPIRSFQVVYSCF